MKDIDLSDLTGLLLIIRKSTGVRYTNQAAGINCNHPVTQGILVPLRTDDSEIDYYGVSGANDFRIDIDKITESLEKMNKLLCEKHGFTLELDTELISSSMEAWVNVIVKEGKTKRKAVLSWENSD